MAFFMQEKIRHPVKRLYKQGTEIELTFEEYKEKCLLFAEYISEQVYSESKLHNLRNDLILDDVCCET